MSSEQILSRTPGRATEDEYRDRVSRSRHRASEKLLWIILIVMVLGGTLIAFVQDGDRATPAELVRVHYGEILTAFVVGIFPIVFHLVFGSMPLEALRAERERRTAYRKLREAAQADEMTDQQPGETDGFTQAAPKSALNEALSIAVAETEPEDLPATTPLEQLHKQSVTSRKTARKLFGRAGVYLFIGVMIAATGLAFFYAQSSAAIYKPSSDMGQALLELAPRFGILFFIEFLAFFFLKQYRAAIDEFRYYEAIMRSREEMVFSYLALTEANDPPIIAEAIRNGMFSSKVSTLAPGHTTELLETRKVEGTDLAALAKILEGVATLKK